MLYPLIFAPIFKERVWGGRRLEEIYHKPLPPGVPVGESWEISDRPGDSSRIVNGRLAGKDLRWLMEHHGRELLGASVRASESFPLLIKTLDAEDRLSLQVHPPATKAAELGGEPKTEMWYIADAAPDAELYVGLKRGVTRAEFERKINDGTVETCFHRLPVKKGDAIFLPSGRVHAIGAGLVIFEVQQNSDTTYRVFDWNRTGLDGKPRQLHLQESLASIDFADFEPELIPGNEPATGPSFRRPLVNDPLFSAQVEGLERGTGLELGPERMQILGLLSGSARLGQGAEALALKPGQFCLVPACLRNVDVRAETDAAFLRIQAGERGT